MMMSYAPGRTIPVASWRRAVSYGELPMSQAGSSVARLLMIAWWVTAALAPALAGVGCARKRATADQAPAPENTLPATLHVSNSNWSDVRIYLVRGGSRLRLGPFTTHCAPDLQSTPAFH